MILTRLGNKRRIAQKITPLFPEHSTYIEPFFGAGGMFFNKSKVKYNLLNDSDKEVFNFFEVLRHRTYDFYRALERMPVHRTLFNMWRNSAENDPVMKAVRFLLLSNWGFLGKSSTMRIGPSNTKTLALRRISETKHLLGDAEFTDFDFRDFFKKVVKNCRTAKTAFIYCDPPYLNTDNNYESGFTQKDSLELFDLLQNSGIRWAMSEFDHPFILEEAKKRGLFTHKIGERKNLLNKRMEVLITNYY